MPPLVDVSQIIKITNIETCVGIQRWGEKNDSLSVQPTILVQCKYSR